MLNEIICALLLVECHKADIAHYEHAVNGSKQQNRSTRYAYQVTFLFLKEVTLQKVMPVFFFSTGHPVVLQYTTVTL